MIGTIYLIGGGEIKNGHTQLIDEDIQSQAPEGSTFVFFGFAAQDSADYFRAVSSVYGHRFKVIMPTVVKGKQFAIDAIRSAAVIYLGGGSTDELLRMFNEWNLLTHLRAALDKGVCIAGMSAGALALSTWYIHDEDDTFELRKGWGIVPIGTLVHANKSSFNKATMVWPGHEPPKIKTLIAIEEGAAWRIEDTKALKVGHGAVWTFTANSY